jgi:hypothetical protein
VSLLGVLVGVRGVPMAGFGVCLLGVEGMARFEDELRGVAGVVGLVEVVGVLVMGGFVDPEG